MRELPTNLVSFGDGGIKARRWMDTELNAAGSYDRIVAALQASADAADRALAKVLSQSLVGA